MSTTIFTPSKLVRSVDWSHEEIHRGHFFSIFHHDADVDTDALTLYRLTTRLKNPHLQLSLIASAAVTLTMFEGPTLTGAGTILPSTNMNRSYPEGSYAIADMVVARDCTVSANGTQLDYAIRVQAASTGPSQAGGNDGSRHEIILAANTNYLVILTPDASNAKTWLTFEWYE